MKQILMERRGTRNPWLWLWKNMERRDRWRSIIGTVGGLGLWTYWMFFIYGGDDGMTHFPAICVLLMVGGDISAMVSVLRHQERRLQDLESKQTPDSEQP